MGIITSKINFSQLVLGLCFLMFLSPSIAQRNSRKKAKNSYAQGTFYAYWGYNRSAYTKSNMRFVGNDYDFTLKNVTASDNPYPLDLSVYLSPTKITIPQFNIRAGYYFWNNWDLSIGYEHMKYIFNDKNEVLLDGYIGDNVDENWSGYYANEPVVTNRKQFHYENSDGLNYINLRLTRTDQWYSSNSKNFSFNTLMGVGAGSILSFNDFNFGGEFTRRTISMSGYGLSGSLGLRFDFFKHVFIQSNVIGGFNQQIKVKNRPDSDAYTSQKYGFIMFDTSIGALFYIRPTNGCNTCPHW